MTGPPIDPTDPLFQPLTFEQVLEITGRKRRTVEQWVAGGKLTAYEMKHRRRIVLFNEDEVLEVEKAMSDAAEANRQRIRDRGGRPGPRKDASGDAT
jgi:hypothetical protein